MAAPFDFPPNPVEGAVYQPPGGSVYSFHDGVWRVLASTGIADAPSDNLVYGRRNATWLAVGGGIPEPTNDGKVYVRKTGIWVEASDKTAVDTALSGKVSKAGDTMLGSLLLPAGDPVLDTQAVHKKYVDTAVSGASSAANAKVSKAGDTMTGVLTLPPGNAAAPSVNFGTAGSGVHGSGSSVLITAGGLDNLTVSTTNVSSAVPVILPANPTADSHAANKIYVDTQVATKIGDSVHDSRIYGRQNGTWVQVTGGGGGGGSVVWDDILLKPDTFPPSPHFHVISDVTGLNTALLGKSDTGHTHAYADITGKPATFPPSAHTHDWAAGITGKPATFPPSAHNHVIVDVTGLQTALDGKEPVITAGNAAHFWAGDKTWKPVPAAGIPEAPSDAKTYGRNNATWVLAPSEAPADTKLYGRKNGAWVEIPASGGGLDQATADGLYINIAGDNMTGVLGLANGTALLPSLAFANSTTTGLYRIAADTIGIATAGVGRLALDAANLVSTVNIVLPGNPTSGLQAATKQYVDTAAGGAYTKAQSDAQFVDVAGDTMTGHLSLPTGPAAANAVRKDYVDAADTTLQTNINAKAATTYVDTADGLRVLKAGDTMTGHLSLPTGPAAANAVRKDYVDAADATLTTSIGAKVAKNGDTMTGALTLPADPTNPLHAATKQYVDAKPSGATISDTAPGSPAAGQLWWESDTGVLALYYNDGNTSQWVGVGGAGIPEAPVDGNTYGRKNNGWLNLTGTYVAKAGDIMTGTLYFDMANPGVVLNTKLSGQSMLLLGQTTSKNRWAVYLGNGTPESGANVGSDFNIQRFSDAGTYIDTPLAINRATGAVLINGATAGGGKAPGDIFTTARNTPPAGALAADGSAVLIASYPKLTDIYCGDATNPTAQWGFKCTNPANPTGSRSTAGTYIALPDCRTYFVRGWNSATRGLYTYEAAMVPEHTHYIPGYQPTGSFTQTGAAVVLAQGGNINTSAAFVGGTENRPANIAFLYCVQYA